MTQTELTQRPVAQIGEAITHELGAQMITDYQAANPTEVKSFQIGRNIIDQILAQPGCVGMRFYNAYNEIGEKTLVYTGVDEFGKALVEYTMVNNDGSFNKNRAIVADRIPPVGNDTEWWEEVINS
ncbi:MAG: hypothetical protein ABIQ88_10010 [Chitinophagaceae bacterium]